MSLGRLAPLTLALLVACSREPEPGPGTQQRNAASRPATSGTNTLGFAVWHDDFPIDLELSRHEAGYWYSRSASQALERVTKNLSGMCTQAAWRFSHEFFWHAPDDAVELLQRELDASLHAPERAAILENVLEAITKMAKPALAASLLKAINHPSDGVRVKAMAALVRSGTKEAVLAAKKNFDALEPRSQTSWIRAAAAHLGADVVKEFQQILEREDLSHLHREILTQCRSLPNEQALAIAKPLFGKASGETKTFLGALLHQKGDKLGTAVLRDALRSGRPGVRAVVIEACAGTDLEWLLPDILKCAIDEDVVVRKSTVLTLAQVPGDNVDKTLETLGLDRDDTVRRTALWALKKRGQRKLLDELAHEIRTATGSRLRQNLEDVAAAMDGGAVPAIFARYEQAAGASLSEAQDYLRVIAYTHAAEAFEPLKKVFLGPPRAFDPAGKRTTINYLPVLLANLTGEEPRVLELFASLPKSEWVRRAWLLHTLANMAGQATREAAELTYGHFRRLLADRTEEPQIRLLALLYLRKDLRLADAMKIKAMLAEEDEPMRKALNDFLFEFF